MAKIVAKVKRGADRNTLAMVLELLQGLETGPTAAARAERVRACRQRVVDVIGERPAPRLSKAVRR